MEISIKEASVISEWIPILISLVGVGLNIFMINKSVKNAIVTKQKDLNLQKLVEVPYLLLDLYEKMLTLQGKALEDELKPQLQKIYSLILAYGGNKSTLIAGEMQQFFYNINGETDKRDSLVYVAILLYQVKYEITNIEGNPDDWYKLKLTDWKISKSIIAERHNELVNKLNLDKFLLIKMDT